MKTCPSCKEEVKDDATKCRHCHHIFNSGTPATSNGGGRKYITISVDNVLVRYAGFLLTILAVFLIIGATLYGVDLKEASDELRNAKELSQTIKSSLADARTDLETLRGNVSEQESLETAFHQIAANQQNIAVLDKKIDSLRKTLVENREEFIEKLTELGENTSEEARGEIYSKAIAQLRSDLGVVSFTSAEKEEIKRSIKIRQSTRPVDAPKGREAEGRSWYDLTYLVDIDNTDVTKKYGGINLIEKVVYHFNPKWYSNADRVRLDPETNFGLSVRVWGVTNVRAEIFVRGFKQSIERERAMSLTEDVEF